MFPSAGLAKKGVEAVVSAAHGLVWRHLAIGLDAMLEAVQLPASIADLHACLADVDWDTFPLEQDIGNFRTDRYLGWKTINLFIYLINKLFEQQKLIYL